MGGDIRRPVAYSRIENPGTPEEVRYFIHEGVEYPLITSPGVIKRANEIEEELRKQEAPMMKRLLDMDRITGEDLSIVVY